MENSRDGKRVTVIIVTHNSSNVIAKCLNSIPIGLKIILVDNASSDETIAIAKNARSDIFIIKNSKNLGFGRANNLALEKVATEFAFLLNPDTVMNEQTISGLVVAADKYSDAAIIAPVMFFDDGNIQKTYKNSIFKRGQKKSKYIVPDGDLCAEFLSGAAMLLKMDKFRKIGFFDKNIFLFYEDDDICIKAKKAGYGLVQTPDATLIHLMGKSSPQSSKYIYLKNWHIMWSRLYIEKKYNGEKAVISLAMREFIKHILKAIGHLLMLENHKIIKSLARSVAVMQFLVGAGAFKD